jgi:hypothetical protein
VSKCDAAQRIDAMMEKASRALVARRYFEAERLCAEALQIAFNHQDYERMARVVLPLQEARRQKRDLAIDAGKVYVVGAQWTEESPIRPGCYLVVPPRVGMDGRQLRERADEKQVPIVVLTREPTTRTGHWPIVALGPVTVRVKVPPPTADDLSAPPAKSTAKKAPAKRQAKPAGEPAPAAVACAGDIEGLPAGVLPAPRWFIAASESLGDAAIAAVDMARTPEARVEELFARLQAHPDHEKLHQRLMEAAIQAARQGVRAVPKPRPRGPESEFLDD